MISKCPEAELLNEYIQEVKDKKTVEEMTADQFWVNFHLKECDDCKELVK